MTGQPLRVLAVIPGEPVGASMIFAKRQVAAVARAGIAAERFFLRSRTSPRLLAAEFVRLRRMLGDFRPDVLHAHYGTVTGLLTVLAAGRTPVVITYRGSDLNPLPSERGPRAWLGHLFSQVAALGAARIVCVSSGVRKRLWWHRGRVTVLPSGVDPAVFYPLPQAAARARLGWPAAGRVVVFNAGRSPANKRLDLAEEACRRARRALPDLRLEILRGDVPPERMPLVMNAADCLLLTSDAEGSPNVILEALASNLPVVSVPAGDAAERLAGVPGTRLVGRHAEELARALVDLTRRPQRSPGRCYAEPYFAGRIAQELVRLYQQAARPAARSLACNTTLSSPSPRS